VGFEAAREGVMGLALRDCGRDVLLVLVGGDDRCDREGAGTG